MKRIDARAKDALRPVEIIPNINRFAEGSCLIKCGDTQVYITASVEDRVPPHVAPGEGWVTAEYNMLPRANRERSRRDVSKLKLSGRSAEIQRLIGRSLRAAVDMKKLSGFQITIDCDVLQGDGGTRTASITGGFVALALACDLLVKNGYLKESPIIHNVAAISAGIVENALLLDLRYEEDSSAMVDLNVVMTEGDRLVEIQGTGEGRAFDIEEQQKLVRLCTKGIHELMEKQNEAIELGKRTRPEV
jgi:ribonuclease PH